MTTMVYTDGSRTTAQVTRDELESKLRCGFTVVES